jgi:two-component system, chemotaxis family, protein-glutamate methylesterase/glutaminase
MNTIKTLLIDSHDTLLERLSLLMENDSKISLIGALNPESKESLQSLLKRQKPDVIVLGLSPDETEVFSYFNLIRTEFSDLPIIVMTPHSEEGARIAIEALKKGAVEFITKTQNFTGSIPPNEHFLNRLLPVIKATPRMNRGVLKSFREIDEVLGKEIVEQLPNKPERPDCTKLLVIVGCLGGVGSLFHVLGRLPGSLPVPVIIVQHMPKIYTRVLAEMLNEISELNILEAENDVQLEPGNVYISPGSYNTLVVHKNSGQYIELYEPPKTSTYRPSMDELLKSVYNVFKNKTLVVYLSGGGSDGIEGAQQIDIIGGQVIIQNRSTSLLWDLPWQIESRGINEGGYPLERISHEIVKRVI